MVIRNIHVLNPHAVRTSGLGLWTSSLELTGLEDTECEGSALSVRIAADTERLFFSHSGEAFVGLFREPKGAVYPPKYAFLADEHHLPAGKDLFGFSFIIQEDDILFLAVPHTRRWQMSPAELQRAITGLRRLSPRTWPSRIKRLLQDTRVSLVVASIGRKGSDPSETGLMPFKIMHSGEFGRYYPKKMKQKSPVAQVEEIEGDKQEKQDVIIISDDEKQEVVVLITDSDKEDDSEAEDDEEEEEEVIRETGSEKDESAEEQIHEETDSDEEFIHETGSEKEEDRVIRHTAGPKIADLLAAARELSSSYEIPPLRQPSPKRPRLDDGLMQLRMVTSRQEHSTSTNGPAGTNTTSRSSTIVRISIPIKESMAAGQEEEKKGLTKKRNRDD